MMIEPNNVNPSLYFVPFYRNRFHTVFTWDERLLQKHPSYHAIAFAVLLTPLQFATPVINGYTLCLTPFLATVLVTALSVILIFRSQVNGNR